MTIVFGKTIPLVIDKPVSHRGELQNWLSEFFISLSGFQRLSELQNWLSEITKVVRTPPGKVCEKFAY